MALVIAGDHKLVAFNLGDMPKIGPLRPRWKGKCQELTNSRTIYPLVDHELITTALSPHQSDWLDPTFRGNGPPSCTSENPWK